ncbi:MAG: hypothetical protein E7223_01500 [Clostridiales bacterium]|nr:hypothetical protein [Clostridiales bacterium]
MKPLSQTIDIHAHIAGIQNTVTPSGPQALAYIAFTNLGYGTLTAVKFTARGYNAFGDPVLISGSESFRLLIQDLNIAPNQRSKTLQVLLPSGEIRKLLLEEYQVCYADGTILTYPGKEEKQLTLLQFEAAGEEGEALQAIQYTYGKVIRYQPQEHPFGWVCGCGRFNPPEKDRCTFCGNAKEQMLKLAEAETRSQLIENVRQQEALRLQQEEERRQQAEIRKQQAKETAKVRLQKFKKRLPILAAALVLVIGVCFLVGHLAEMASRATFSSLPRMQAELEGTYTCYSESGTAIAQIILSDDTATYRYSSGSERDFDIRAWDYENGIVLTYEELVAKKDGTLVDESGFVYRPGGTMKVSSSSSGSSSGSSGSSGSSYETIYTALSFSNVKVTHNSSYTVCTGTVKNNGKKTYKFVEIKGQFKNYSGTVLDTDWTYAVGSEGLGPGESKTFRMSVPKNASISSCSISIIDYN